MPLDPAFGCRTLRIANRYIELARLLINDIAQ